MFRASRLALVFLVVAALAGVVPAVAETSREFVEGFEDLPLMPGLANVPEAGIAFDKPAGRIVVAYARGAVRRGNVVDFYRQTLPQLGWAKRGPAEWSREGERLAIDFLGADGDLVVRYTLSPE
jgi:hypothetical protein